MTRSSENKTRLMQLILFFGVVLLCIKFFAWWITRSNAILTDALESIVNVVAGTFALISIMYASRPRDKDHPYGHGKIEFVSAGFEGGLILLAGGGIIFEATKGFFFPHPIPNVNIGAWLTVLSGSCNFIMGMFLARSAERQNSSLMQASSRHLLTDTVSSAVLVAGLFIIYFTGKAWLDNVLAIFLGCWIIFTGFKIVRESLGNLLDEQDMEKVNQLVKILNENRRANWIDMHNLRIQKYGPGLHIDAHITLPWYLSLERAHDEVSAVENLITKKLDRDVEFFIHTDPCLPQCCPICDVKDCPERKSPKIKMVKWTTANMMPDKKHSIES